MRAIARGRPRLDAGDRAADLWRDIGALLWGERALIARAIGLVMLNRAAALAIPVAAKVAIDDVVVAHRSSLIVPLGAGVLLSLVVEAATASQTTRLVGEGTQRTVTALRDDLFAHVIRLPVFFFDAARSGELTSRVMDDTEQVRGLIGPMLVSMSGAVIMGVAAFAIMAWVAWPVAVGVGALSVAATVLIARAYSRLSTTLGMACARYAALGARLTEAMVGIRTIKSRGAERWECGEFRRAGG